MAAAAACAAVARLHRAAHPGASLARCGFQRLHTLTVRFVALLRCVQGCVRACVACGNAIKPSEPAHGGRARVFAPLELSLSAASAAATAAVMRCVAECACEEALSALLREHCRRSRVRDGLIQSCDDVCVKGCKCTLNARRNSHPFLPCRLAVRRELARAAQPDSTSSTPVHTRTLLAGYLTA